MTHPLALALTLISLGATSAHAQTLLFDLPFTGPVGGVTDLTGDGQDEFLIGRRVFSGADGSPVLDLTGVLEMPCDAAAVGDLNDDGFDDLVYVSVRPGSATCAVFGPVDVTFVSGADGSTLGNGPSNLFFQQIVAVTAAGDASGDGVLEIAWASENYINGCPSGEAGFHQPTPPSGSALGQVQDCWAVAGLGDVSGDGLPDVAVGNGSCGVIEEILIVSNAGGQPALVRSRAINGTSSDGLAAIGDLDGDGLVDLVAVDQHFQGGGLHRARVFSGADLSILLELPGAGDRVAGPGDIDCDGRVDVLSSGPGLGTRIWSGLDGSLLWEAFEEPPSSNYESSRLAAAGDVDGDGFPDWIVSFDSHTQVWAGAGPAVTTYCTAKTNSQGCVPFVQTAGVPSVSSAQPFLATARQVVNQKNGLLFYGTSGRAALPWLGGTLCAQPSLVRTPLQSSFGNPPPNDCSGAYAFDLNAWIQAGNDPALVPGTTVDGQFWSRDPQQPDGTGVGLSDAFEGTVCP